MATTLTVRDESMKSAATRECGLAVPAERMSIRELIRSKAFWLARDDEITDPTITSQLRRN